MVAKRRIFLIVFTLVAASLIALWLLNVLPLNFLSVQQKPEQAPQKVYEYYIIVEAETDRTLMYVPLIVSVGDELITEDNKRYKVVRIEENRAYARFVENVDIEQFKEPQKK